MAIGTPVERYAQSLSAQAATSTFSPTGTIAAGSFAVLACTTSLAADSKIPTSVTDDTGGNTWNIDVLYDSANVGLVVAFVSCQVKRELTTSSVITINWSPSTGNQAHIWLQEVAGIAKASAFDQTAVGQSSGATSIATGASGGLAQRDEIVFGCVRSEGLAGWTKGATYTDATTPILGSNLSALEYKIVAALTAVTADGTQTSATNNWSIALATYKGALPSGYQRLVGPLALTTSATTLYTVPSGARAHTRRFWVNNPTAGSVTATFSIGSDAAGTRVVEVPIPAGEEYDFRQKFDLEVGEVIQGKATATGLVAIIDGYMEVA